MSYESSDESDLESEDYDIENENHSSSSSSSSEEEEEEVNMEQRPAFTRKVSTQSNQSSVESSLNEGDSMPGDSAHSAAASSDDGKGNMPWLMPTARTGGGVALGPFASPMSFNSSEDTSKSSSNKQSSSSSNKSSDVKKLNIRVQRTTQSPKQNQNQSMDISNHKIVEETAASPPASPKSQSSSSSSNSGSLVGILVFRLSAAKENSSNPPLCLAKYNLNESYGAGSGASSSSSKPPTKSYGRGVKVKAAAASGSSGSDGNGIDHSEIAFQLQEHPPNHTSGIMQKRLKDFQTLDYNGNKLVYGAEITSKSTRPICCVAVTSPDFPQNKAEEILQQLYFKFNKQHGSYQVQNAKIDLALQDQSVEMMKDVCKKYQQSSSNASTKTANPLQSTTTTTPSSLLGKNSSHHSDKDSDDDLLASASPPKTSDTVKNTPVRSTAKDDETAGNKPPWATQKLRPAQQDRSKLVEKAFGDDVDVDDSTVDSPSTSRKTSEDAASTTRPPWATQALRPASTNRLKMEERSFSDDAETDSAGSHENYKAGESGESGMDEDHSDDEETVDDTEHEEAPTPSSSPQPEFVTKMASLRAVRKDTATIATGNNTTTTVSETTAAYTAKSITATAYNDRLATTPRSILLEENKNNSVQSTLGGSVVHDRYDEMTDSSDDKNAPIWAKAKHSLRAAPPIKRPEKKPSLPPATKEDLRPTPQHESGNASGAVPFSPHSLRSVPRSDSQDANEKGHDHEVGAVVAATLSQLSPRKDNTSPRKSPTRSRAAVHSSSTNRPSKKDADAMNSAGAIAMESAMSNKPRPIGADETLRKPTRSSYDNWGLVKKQFLPSIQLDHEEDASTISHSMDGDANSEASKSGSSDWGVPTQYQNEDDSSWVNPARPVDPKRKQKLKAEVDRLFVKHLEETRLRSLADMPLYENKQESDAFAAEEDDGESRQRELTPEMMTRPGSFDEEKGWSMPSDTTTLDIARCHPQHEPPSVEEMAWSMPSKATEVGAVYRKTEVEQKDYRYTYITARSALADKSTNDVPQVSSYWDKIRQNYFDNDKVPLPTDGAVTATTVGDNRYRPSWKTTAGSGCDDDDQTEDSEWLPPDYSTNPAYRTIAAQARARSEAAGTEADYKIDPPSVAGAPDGTTRSVATSDSDWEPPSNTKMNRRIDFAGRVMYQNDSDGSDAIPWVPRPEDLVFESSEEEEGNESSSGEEEEQDEDADRDPSGVFQDSYSSESYSSDFANTTEYSSIIKFGDDEDDESRDEFVQNPTMPTSNASLDVGDDDELMQAVSRKLHAIEEGRPGAIRHPSGIKKSSRDSSRESSSASLDASVDSVLSYTGRISFCTTPELITFEDEPNEERGTHYTKIARGKKGKDEEYKSRGSSNGPDPCVYYSLCCIMVLVPAAVLSFMFVFVIDLNGDNDDENGSN